MWVHKQYATVNHCNCNQITNAVILLQILKINKINMLLSDLFVYKVCNVCYGRIRKGFPYEARVITRILPAVLTDIFPPTDIMNKVIAEFLSSQQPHPELMANVLFQVFILITIIHLLQVIRSHQFSLHYSSILCGALLYFIYMLL